MLPLFSNAKGFSLLALTSTLYIMLLHSFKRKQRMILNISYFKLKAAVAKLLKKHTNSRVCAVGDGGNDVSMIQEANVGIGIIGKEGMKASLAADFSVKQFSAITRLLLWHGRNAYQRSARLSQFIIHRGLIISFIQVCKSCVCFVLHFCCSMLTQLYFRLYFPLSFILRRLLSIVVGSLWVTPQYSPWRQSFR